MARPSCEIPAAVDEDAKARWATANSERQLREPAWISAAYENARVEVAAFGAVDIVLQNAVFGAHPDWLAWMLS